MNVDVITTATLRPELLEITYSSLFRHVTEFSPNRLLINVDPAPIGNATVDDVLDVARRHFKRVVYRHPSHANCALAVQWLWSTAETPFIFYLEDDWETIRPFRFADLTDAILKSKSSVVQARLRTIPGRHDRAVRGMISFRPSVMSRSFISRVVGHLNDSSHPEVQIRQLSRFGIDRMSCGVVICGKKPVMRDIGRDWSRSHGVQRGSKQVFVRWQSDGTS